MAAPTSFTYAEGVTHWVGNIQDGGDPNHITTSWAVGDIVVVLAGVENDWNEVVAVTGSGLAFTRQANVGDPVAGASYGSIWTSAPATGTGTDISVSWRGPTPVHGGVASLVVKGSNGIGAVAVPVYDSTNKTISLTRSQANSAVLFFGLDAGAEAPTAFTPAGSVTRFAAADAGRYTCLIATWADADAPGTTVYGQSGDPAANVTRFAIEVLGVPSSTNPTCSAGPDVTKETGSAAFTITGTATPVAPATIVAHSWAQVSGPTIGLGGTGTQTVTVTPGQSTGTAVLRYTVTDSTGKTATDDTNVVLIAPGQFFRPVGDVAAAGWTATPVATPMSSNIDDTVASSVDYVSSPDNPAGQEYKFRLEPRPAPGAATGVYLEVMLWLTAPAATQSTVVRLYESNGSTARKAWTITDLTQVPTVRQLTLSEAEAGTITDWNSGLVIGVAATLT